MDPGARILVVDDEASVRYFADQTLTGDGHQVVAVESGEAALEFVEKQEFDLALLDLKLKGMGGLEVLAALRQQSPATAMLPRPGTALIAPDDYHLQLNAKGVVELSKEAPYKGLRPSANYLFRSLAWSFGSRSMGVILTGMGDDGSEGLADLHRAGGLTVAQDEASCVVYGMPREAVIRQVIDRILAPEQIAASFQQLALVRGRSRVASGKRGGR